MSAAAAPGSPFQNGANILAATASIKVAEQLYEDARKDVETRCSDVEKELLRGLASTKNMEDLQQQLAVRHQQSKTVKPELCRLEQYLDSAAKNVTRAKAYLDPFAQISKSSRNST